MRLDNKYFPLFIACCAILTLVVIFYGSISYQQSQEKTLRSNISTMDLPEQQLPVIGSSDTLRVGDLQGEPVLIHFWASWSDRSKRVEQQLADLKQTYPEITILAASVRDDEEYVTNSIRDSDYDFFWVNGHDLYYDLQVPGIPSQILLNRDGTFHNVQIGEDEEALDRLVGEWMNR